MLNITFQQLEVFQKVAEQLNMTDAAEKLYISQSALSKMIVRLESSLGVRLFNRGNHGVTLTAEGRYLYDSIQKPMAAILASISHVQSMEVGNPTLHICCTSTFLFNSAYNPMKEVISAFCKKYATVDVQESICEIAELQNALSYGSADIAICQEFVVTPLPNIDYEPVGSLGVYLTIAESNPLSRLNRIPPEKLADEPMYVLTTENYEIVRERSLNMCKAMGFEPKHIRTVPNMLTFIRAMGSGTGFFIGGKLDRLPADVGFRYYPLDEKTFPDSPHIVVAWRHGELKGDIQRFVSLVRKIAPAQR